MSYIACPTYQNRGIAAVLPRFPRVWFKYSNCAFWQMSIGMCMLITKILA